MKIPILETLKHGSKLPQLLVVVTVNIVTFATGCHTGWPAPSLPKLLSDEFPFEVSNSEASYVTIIGHVGNMCGGLVSTILLDKIGRKKTILLIALPQMVSFLFIILSYQVMELLYVARYIGGISEGMCFTVVPIYIAEIAEPAIRGALNTIVSITCLSSIVYVNIVGSFLSIRTTAMTFLVFPLLFLASFWKMPESPYYLLMKGRQQEARKSLQFLRNMPDVSDEVETLTAAVNRQMCESKSYKDIFCIESNRKAFIAVVGARIVQQCTGITAFSLYIQLLIAEATDAIPAYLGSTILLLVQLSMTTLSTLFVDRWGRKPLLLFSTGGCCLDLLILAIYFGFKESGYIGSGMDWFPLLMMTLFVIWFSTGLAMAINILGGEIFSASVKGKCACLVNVFFALSMLASTKFYQITADSFGLTVPYGSFGCATALGVIFIYFCVPETKGKTLEEIQLELKSKKRTGGAKI